MTELRKQLLELDEQTEQQIIKQVDKFRGNGTTLESALGALIVGQIYGWRVLKLLHNPSTYRNYEKILGVKFNEVCPEITETGKSRSVGYAISEKLGSFWAIIMGKKKVDGKGQIDSQKEVERRVAEYEKENDQ